MRAWMLMRSRFSIEEFDSEHSLLMRQLDALERATDSEYNIKLAKDVITENAKEIEGLREDWDWVLDELETKFDEYLSIITKLRPIYDRGRILTSEINEARESIPRRGPIKHVPGVGGNIDLQKLKGAIFIDNNLIAKAFMKGERP